MAIFSKKPKPTKIHSLDELKPMIDSGKPVLLDFMQVGCSPCQVMDGIMNELAREYGESAHVVKIDVGKVPGAAQAFNVRSTPTFVLLSSAPSKQQAKKARKGTANRPNSRKPALAPRWRTSGLVKKDQLERVLEGNGAQRITA
jgi:thiol-disulfide isomerase/thioredoxin